MILKATQGIDVLKRHGAWSLLHDGCFQGVFCPRKAVSRKIKSCEEGRSFGCRKKEKRPYWVENSNHNHKTVTVIRC